MRMVRSNEILFPHQVVFCTSTDPIEKYIEPENVLSQVGGALDHHNQLQWIEYFAILEPLQNQCISSGKKLVTVMGDIRNADIQVSYWITATHCGGTGQPLWPDQCATHNALGHNQWSGVGTHAKICHISLSLSLPSVGSALASPVAFPAPGSEPCTDGP